MRPIPADQMAELSSSIIAQCLDLAEQVKLPVRDLSTMSGASPATLYRWQKGYKAGKLADPEGKMAALAFLNLLIFRNAAQKTLAEGKLPYDGKKGAQQWIRELAPDAFQSDVS